MLAKPICFVIMGFGMKVDYESGDKVNLDATYKNIIRPAADRAGFRCVRADEIQDSGLIDRSMYALLLRAELVIADISTFNPNALYELGIRHAARPYSTIIIKSGNSRIPFDIDHTRIFTYKHLGSDIGTEEAERCVRDLSALIKAIGTNPKADSPVYEYMADLQPLELSDEQYEEIVTGLMGRENSIFALSENALLDMQRNEFTAAAAKWEKAAKIADNEPYFIQQQALCTYKSKNPSAQMALTNALAVINKLSPEDTNDPETLGIAGAIYKNLFLETKESTYLDKAIELYRKGFTVADDYYTGENYVTCLELREEIEANAEEATYYRIAAIKTRDEIIRIINEIDKDDLEKMPDQRWVYATLSNMMRGLGDDSGADDAERTFLELSEADWERATFEQTKAHVIERRSRNISGRM